MARIARSFHPQTATASGTLVLDDRKPFFEEPENLPRAVRRVGLNQNQIPAIADFEFRLKIG